MSEAGRSESLDRPGSLVMDRYRLVRVLGVGGMGAVYLARTEGAGGFRKPVVLKRIHPKFHDDPDQLRAFVREARVSSLLSHPNIVPVHDFREEGGTYWMVLDYVAGYDLNQWMRYRTSSQEPIEVDHALRICASILSALGHAHQLRDANGQSLRIVHRDVSPSNVLLSVDGRIYLTDFGIARMREDVSGYRTEKASIKGKFHCLAPELLEGADASPSSDLYSTALLLHQMLAGKNEFRAQTMAKTVALVLTHTPSRLSPSRSDVPAELDAILARALAKDPSDRPPTALALADELEAVRRSLRSPPLRSFEASLARDFADPRFAHVNRVDSVAEREEAWRTFDSATRKPPDEVTIEITEDEGASAELAVQTPAASTPSPVVAGDQALARALSIQPGDHSEGSVPEARRRPNLGRLGLGAIVVFALTAIVVTGYVATRTGAVAQPPLVTRERITGPETMGTPSARPTSSTAVAAPAPRAPSAEAPASSPRRAPSRRPAERTIVRRLTEKFARRSPQVEACFRTPGLSVVRAPELLIQFEIDRTGRVLSARVEPAALAETALGACLLEVARSTSFGPQSDSLAFQIPVRAHGRPSD
ncbi:MAG: serine/threonine protein kinase [Deltaproteobacteria bacterium]|nr:serine/threonine protein kinase [Deltaproteobacteria bacterium]